LGASISTFSTLDASVVVLSALKSTLDEALNIYADVILNPSFDAEELERQRQQQLAEIRQEKKDPSSMAGRVLPQLLFGENHAYSNPRSGNEESVGKITVQDLTQFHEQWFKPNHATVVAVGDITLDELVPKLEAAFQNWQPGEIPEKNLAAVDFPEKSTVYILDRPDSESSVVLAAHLAPPKSSPDDMTLDTLNMVLGGDFTSRINMNLREDKHWSYGAHSDFRNARGPGVFAVSTSVQADKTAESMTEIKREIQAIQSDRPPTEEELNTILKKQVLQRTGRWETLGAVAGSLQEMIEYNLPEDYYDTYSEAVRKIEVGMLSDAAKKYLKPENLTWVVVGDRQSIEESIRALNLGEVKILNADGELVQ
jgi:zinc protease